jgi:L-aspartate oxidase
MGGVHTDLEGRTSLDGLYAAGEVACTGVHGANRLASNSLLEGVVFGARAGAAMRESAASDGSYKSVDAADAVFPCTTEERMRRLAWENCGIIRTGEQLESACRQLQADRMTPNPAAGLGDYCLRNMHTIALLIARCAFARRESRGAHFRTDFSEKQQEFEKHSVVVKGHEVRFR